jgi:hypothetical protein
MFEALEQITIAGPPLGEAETGIIPMSFEIVSLWTRSRDNQPSRGRSRLRLLTPGGVALKEQEYGIDLSVNQRNRTRVRIAGLPILGAGRHEFILHLQRENEIEWREVGKLPLQIVLEITNRAG